MRQGDGNMRLKKWLPAGLCLLAMVSAAWAGGPVILGGDDLQDHGSRSGSTNIQGWLYIEKAISSLNAQSTRPGVYTTTIAAIGSADPGAGNYPNDAGGAINSVANVLGLAVTFYDGPAAITSFFAGLASGSINPKVIWLSGNGAGNDTDSTEAAVINVNGAALNAYVASGGGLMSHGNGATIYGWLSALIPGITLSGSCSTPATLTAAGMAAFPLLTNADVSAGPCHGSFGGSFGGLVALAIDSNSLPFIIGGLTGAGGIVSGGGCPNHVHSHTFPFGHGSQTAHAPGHAAGDPRHGHHFTCSNHIPGHSPFGLMPDPGEEILVDTGFVAAQNLDGSASEARAAKRGGVLRIFGSAAGFVVGEQDYPGIRFTPPAAGPLFTTATPEVRVGGVAARVLFSGFAPGLTGVWQINFLIPEEAPAGDAVPITVFHEGREVKSISAAIQ